MEKDINIEISIYEDGKEPMVIIDERHPFMKRISKEFCDIIMALKHGDFSKGHIITNRYWKEIADCGFSESGKGIKMRVFAKDDTIGLQFTVLHKKYVVCEMGSFKAFSEAFDSKEDAQALCDRFNEDYKAATGKSNYFMVTEED